MAPGKLVCQGMGDLVRPWVRGPYTAPRLVGAHMDPGGPWRVVRERALS